MFPFAKCFIRPKIIQVANCHIELSENPFYPMKHTVVMINVNIVQTSCPSSTDISVQY